MIRTRREFCTHACHAATLAAAGALLNGCGGDDGGNPSSPTPPLNTTPAPGTALATVSASVTGQTVSIPVTGTPLSNAGSAATTSTSLGTFLIAHGSQDSFTVLTAVCTHEGCTINGFSNARFLCPCHGSQYSTSGAVLNGPAVSPLRQYPASLADGTLTFSV